MPMRNSVRSVVTACVAAGVVGCGSAKEEPVPEQDVVPAPPEAGDLDLAGTAWRLVRFEGGDGTVLTPDDRSKYTLTFEPGGRLAARVDCNRGSGTWRSSGPSLELGPLALTRAMCPPGSLHDRIVKQLPYVRTYLVRDDHLFLSLMADGGIYELEPLTGRGVADKPLEGPRWKLTHVDGEPVRREAGQAEAYLTFDPASLRVSGSGGCNHIGGTYRGKGESLELSRMVGTLMACEKGMETERAFLQALERVRGWKITGDVLELTGERGEVVARFEAGS